MFSFIYVVFTLQNLSIYNWSIFYLRNYLHLFSNIYSRNHLFFSDSHFIAVSTSIFIFIFITYVFAFLLRFLYLFLQRVFCNIDFQLSTSSTVSIHYISSTFFYFNYYLFILNISAEFSCCMFLILSIFSTYIGLIFNYCFFFYYNDFASGRIAIIKLVFLLK